MTGAIERELRVARGLASCLGDEAALDEADAELRTLRARQYPGSEPRSVARGSTPASAARREKVIVHQWPRRAIAGPLSFRRCVPAPAVL